MYESFTSPSPAISRIQSVTRVSPWGAPMHPSSFIDIPVASDTFGRVPSHLTYSMVFPAQLWLHGQIHLPNTPAVPPCPKTLVAGLFTCLPTGPCGDSYQNVIWKTTALYKPSVPTGFPQHASCIPASVLECVLPACKVSFPPYPPLPPSPFFLLFFFFPG